MSPSPRMDQAPGLPRRSEWFFRAFQRYAHRYIRKHFHALRLDREGLLPAPASGPAIVVSNHPSWWDPMVALVLMGRMPADRIHFAPIDLKAWPSTPFWSGSASTGWNPDPAGGLRFLRQSLRILAEPNAVIWIAAQGEFTDIRDRPVRLRPGIGHLAHRQSTGTLLPLALEYPFWNDRAPEVLVRFGPPIDLETSREPSPDAWTARVEVALEQAQDALARNSRRRDPGRFDTLVGGSAGVGGVYDAWRRLRARIRGESFRPEHQVRNHPHEP